MAAARPIVWLASFPKSGNTWFRIFLANLNAGEAGPADINNLDERGGIASSRYEFEEVTLLDSSLLAHDDVDRLRPRVYEAVAAETCEPRWIKVHDAYTATDEGEPLFGCGTARAAIYLVRDPRDIAVSLAHHHDTTIDAAIALMNRPGGEYCSDVTSLARQLRQKLNGWSGHVTSWLDQGDVPVHTVRYEDLLAEPVARFGAALKFANRPATDEEIARAVGHSDFAELQRQEAEKGFGERMPCAASFFRAGRAGGWRESLTRAQVDAIEQCHAAVMARLGYAVSGKAVPTDSPSPISSGT